MIRKHDPFSLLTRRHFLKLLGGSSVALTLSACGTSEAPDTPAAPAPSAGEPQRGGTLSVALSEDVSSLFPLGQFSFANFQLAQVLYEGLTWLDSDGNPQPALATAWEESDDQLTWTFTLREGVTFHHGTPFTAEDVVATFEPRLDPASGSRVATIFPFVDRVEAVDDTTVQFHLKSPYVDLAHILGVYIIPKDRSEEELTNEPAGTGPFRLAESLPGEQISVVRNEDYWQEGQPYLDEVRFVVMPESATRTNALLSGTLDLISEVDLESIAVLEEDARVRLIEGPAGSQTVFAMKVDEEPFDDVRVRQALKHCVDREAMIQTVLQGHGVVANDQSLPPISPYWADVPPLEYDTDRAKELLAEAGYPDGLDITLIVSPVGPGMVESAVALQEMAKPSGINIALERVSPADYWSEQQANAPFAVSNWTLQVTDNYMLSLTQHSEAYFNLSNYENPELDELIEETRAEQDFDKRREMYAMIQEIVRDDGGFIVPYFRPVITATQANVQGVGPLRQPFARLHEVWLSEA